MNRTAEMIAKMDDAQEHLHDALKSLSDAIEMTYTQYKTEPLVELCDKTADLREEVIELMNEINARR